MSSSQHTSRSSSGQARSSSAQLPRHAPRPAPPSLPRRQSTHERIQDILQTGIQRADSIEAIPGPSTMTHSPINGRHHHDESPSPTETTAMFSGIIPQLHSYQSTETRTSPRERRGIIRIAGEDEQSSPTPRPRIGSRMVSSSLDRRRTDSAREGEGEDTRHTWLGDIFAPFRSIELENKGSTARDHLALERTFLAWLRTSLAFASIGIAITQLFRLNTSLMDKDGHPSESMKTLRKMGKPLGATFLGISIAILFLGYRRYLMGQQWILNGKFPASRGTVIIVAFMAFSIMIASLVVVIAVGPRSDEL